MARHFAFQRIFASCNFAWRVVFPYCWVSHWSDVSRLRQTSRYADQICQFNILWKVLLRRDFSKQLCHRDETVLSNFFLSYKVPFNSKCRWEGHHAAISYFLQRKWNIWRKTNLPNIALTTLTQGLYHFNHQTKRAGKLNFISLPFSRVAQTYKSHLLTLYHWIKWYWNTQTHSWNTYITR